MAIAEPLNSGPQLSKTIFILHSVLPLIVGAYYFIATIVSYLRQPRIEVVKVSKVQRNVIFWLVFGVAITYATEAIVLLCGLISGVGTPPRQDNLVYVFASALLWFVFLMGFSDSSSSPGYPLFGCWAIYTVGEIMLLSFGVTITRLHSGLVATIVGLQALRVVTQILVCAMAVNSRITFPKKTGDEEESSPLLGQRSQAPDDSADPQQPVGDNGYGSILPNQNKPKAGNDKADGDEEVKNQSTIDYIKSFRVLLPFLWPTGKIHLQLLYVGVGLCLVVNRVLNVLVPLQIGLITNILSESNSTLPLKEIAVFIVLRLLDSSGGIEAIRSYMWQPLANYTYERIGQAAFDKVMTLSSDFHDNKHSGSLWLSIARGQSIRHLMSAVLFQVVPMLVDLVLAISVLYYLFDAYMALIIAAVVVTFLWSAGKILSRQTENRRERNTNLQKEHDILCEATGNWETVSYFNRVPYEKSRYFSALASHMKSVLVLKRWDQVESVVQSFLLMSGLMAACFLAAYQVIQGIKPVGSFVMLLSYWAQLSGPLQFFAGGFVGAILDLVDAEDLLSLLKRQPTVFDEEDAKEMTLNDGEIEFRNVNFSYDNHRDIVKDTSFRVAPGQTVALVGETGGGKSTIMKLISRLYDPTEGTIFVDGQDIRHVTLESLRANIGIVPQDPALFHDTIMNNIRYANFGASDEEIFEACKAVALHEKFLSFPDGYETLVGERGMKLSGGELQRVAIARAIVKSPKIVLLDEATSSVDSETEARIQESLGALSAGRTTFVIAHRLSTISHADKILVIQDGTIVEQGTHEALLNNRGRYYSLWSRQGFFLSDDAHPQNSEPAPQKEHQPLLIDVSEDKEVAAPSNAGPASARGTSENSSKVNKEVWRPDAPVFVPCNISRWTPTPVIPESRLRYPALSPYATNKQVAEDQGEPSKLPTAVSDPKKENTSKTVAPDMSGPKTKVPSDRENRPVVPSTSGEAAREPRGNQLISHPETTDAQAIRRDWLDSPRRKRKRATRMNTSKSNSAGVNRGDDGSNDSSTPTDLNEDPIGQPSLETGSPTLSTNVDSSTNQRRRRRNRHLKSRSPRKPLLSVTNGGSDTPTATPSAPSMERFRVSGREPTGVLRFPPAA